MKTIVLGAGLAGITTAYELNRDGWEVTVVDRESGPAMFTSFANAGLFASGHSYAWSSPAAPKILLHSLWRHDQALRFKPTSDPALWRWMFKFFGQCTAERAALNTSRKARLALYSQEVFHETLGRHDLHFDGNTGGLIYFYRTHNAFERAGTRKHILTDAGVHIETLSADEAAQKDPALEPVKHQISGALFSEHDESGDAHLFTHELAKVCKKNGVKFLWNRTIKGFAVTRQAISSLITDKGPLTGDIFVNALGVYTPHLARQLEDEVPVYPVKGYSATVPTKGRNNIPNLGGVDEENLIAYCPMGNRLRITATAEFSGYDRSHTPKDFAHMLDITRALFPDSADFDQPSYWAGLRPMTPEGTPIFGKGKCTNLWYVSGLGHMGWTMCHGAGRITADLIAGKTPAIPLEGMVLGE